ncbi:MAG: hypothetical protein Q9224_003160, partial [Gallowayella concinna]
MKLYCSALLLGGTLLSLPVRSHAYAVNQGNVHALQPRQIEKEYCYDLNAPMRYDCWDILQLDPYIQKHFNSTPACQPAESWSTCFIRLGSNHSDAACNTIGSTNCGPGLDSLSPYLDPSIQPSVRYVLATIEQVHSLFTELARSVKRVDAEDPVLAKLRTNPLNLTAEWDVPAGDYRTALTLGVPYIGAQIGTGNVNIGKTLIPKPIFSLSLRFLAALERTPRVTDRMYPADSLGPADTNDVFDSGLQYLMSNARAFTSFAQGGVWTIKEDFNKTLQADNGAGLGLAAATLYTTLALRRNGFDVTFFGTPDENLARSAPDSPSGIYSCTSLARNVGQICPAAHASSARYFSGVSGNIFLFNSTVNLPNVNAERILLDIFDNS